MRQSSLLRAAPSLPRLVITEALGQGNGGGPYAEAYFLNYRQGQHEPLFDELVPYEQFPDRVDGPTLWVKEDYQTSPEKWQYRFTPDDVRISRGCRCPVMGRRPWVQPLNGFRVFAMAHSQTGPGHWPSGRRIPRPRQTAGGDLQSRVSAWLAPDRAAPRDEKRSHRWQGLHPLQGVPDYPGLGRREGRRCLHGSVFKLR